MQGRWGRGETVENDSDDIKKKKKWSSDSPAEAEESQIEAQQSGHHMSDEGTGLTGVEVEPEPHGHQQGEQLTCHEVYLHRHTTTTGLAHVWNREESKKINRSSWI